MERRSASATRAIGPDWAVGEEVVDHDVSPSWSGLVLTSLLVAAARAAAAGTFDTDEAADLVSRTLFDGLGAARVT